MARLVLQGAGFLVGGPIGMVAGGLLGSLLFPEKKHVEGPRIADRRQQTSAYGVGIPDIYGGIRVAGNVIWAAELREVANTTSQGKGGPSATQTTYSYFASFAILLCRGPIVGYRRVWANGELLVGSALDPSASNQAAIEAALNQSNPVGGGIAFYSGTETQDPDPTMEAAEGVGNVPGYRGWAYMVFTDLPVDRYGGARPNIEVEVLQGTAASPTATEQLRIASPFGTQNTGDWIGAQRDRVWWFGLNRPGSLVANNWTISDKGTGGPEGGGGSNEPSSPPHEFASNGYLNQPRHERLARPDTSLGEIYKPAGDSNNFDLVVFKRARGGLTTTGNFSRELHFANTRSPTDDSVFVDTSNESTWQGWGRYIVRGRHVVAWSTFAQPAELYYTKHNIYGGWEPVTVIPHPEGPTQAGEIGGRRFALHPNATFLYQLKIDPGDSTKIRIARLAWPFTGAWDLTWRTFDRGALSDSFINTTTNEGIWTTDRQSNEFVLLSFNGNVIRRYAGQSINSQAKYHFWVQGRLLITARDSNIYYYVPDDIGAAVNTGVPLADVVSDICQKVGVPHDVSLLTGTVLGHLRAEPMSARAAIESLQQSHFFDAVESGNVIKFVPRGQASVKTIPVDQFLLDVPFSLTRAADLELPRRVTVRYIAHNADYQQGAQQTQRIITGAEGEITVDLPTVLEDAHAARAAEVLLFDAWQSRESSEIGLPGDYARLEPTDVITIEAEDGTYDVRIVDQDYDVPHTLVCRGVVEDANVYTSTAPAQAITVTPASLPFTGETELMILDIPLLDDTHNPNAVYAVAYADVANWPGAEVHRSADGVSFDAVATVNTGATVGTLSTALGEPVDFDVVDDANTIEIELTTGGPLASVTEAEFLNNANAILIGSEIITFRDATLVATNRYELKHLTRGRRGTELWADHRAGERVVLLNDAVFQIPVPVAQLRTDVTYRAPTFGTLLANAPDIVERYEGITLRPYAPTQLQATDNGNGTFNVTWVPRTRIGGAWIAGAGATQADTPESYEVKVYQGGVGTTLLSTATVSSPAATVTAATGNRVTVAQVSSTYGAGETVDLTL